MRRKSEAGWKLLVVLLSLGFAAGVAAQEREPQTKRRLRVLTVGDAPPFRQEIRNGVRHELEAPKGSIPPRELVAFTEGVEQGRLRVGLKRVSPPLVLTAAPQLLTLSEETEAWHRLNVPEGGDMLAVLWRDPKERKWSKVRSLLLKDGPEFQPGQVRFLNVAPVAVTIALGKNRFVLKPGASSYRKIGVTEGTAFRIAYALPDGKGWKQFYSSVLVQNRGERTTAVTYLADGKKPRSPLKLVTLRETLPPPLKKREDPAAAAAATP